MVEKPRPQPLFPRHPGGPMSVEEYMQLDDKAVDARYEYINGVARLMAGGTFEHDDIGHNLYAALKLQFRNGPCSVHGDGVKAQVGTKDDGTPDYVYPDATVSCNVADRKTRGQRIITSPLIVFEVLSPSNENDDRTIKMRSYQSCPTIRAIVLVSQFARHVEVYERLDHDLDTWVARVFNGDEAVKLDCMDLEIEMDDIYLDIDFSLPLEGEEE